MTNPLLCTLGLWSALAAMSPGVAAATQPGSAELARAIERLSIVGNVLYVAAHPDDENTRLLAYLVRERGLATTYLSLTRGDGGQNLLGPEQGAALGLIRTQELLRARAVDGAQQRFARARDFGYSKTPAETLAIWDRDAVLADVVWTIRVTRPDVIVTRFSPTGTDTHGHHTASAILALAAFKAAADPTFLPEQVKLAGAWQARRIVWNQNGDSKGAVTIDTGGYEPALGRSYGELAADSRTMHKSQGMGTLPSRASSVDSFTLLDGAAMTSDPLDGVHADWTRVSGSERLRALLAEARTQFAMDAPWKSLDKLVEVRAALDALAENPWKAQKRAELDRVIAACSGVFVEASATAWSVLRRGVVPLSLTVVQRTPLELSLVSIALPGQELEPRRALKRYEAVQLDASLAIPPDAPLVGPYWLETPPSAGLYHVDDQRAVGLPERAPPVATFGFRTRSGASFFIATVIDHKWLDPVAGEQHRAVEVLPAATLTPAASVLMFAGEQPRTLRVVVKASVGKVDGSVRAEVPAGFSISPDRLPFSLADKDEEQVLSFTVHAPRHGDHAAVVRFIGDAGTETLERGLRRIAYPHIPIQTMLLPAEVKLVRVELHRGANSRVGYVAGAGDEVAAMLEQVGYEVTALGPDALRGDLSRFGAIVLGVRAYNTSAGLLAAHDALESYVARGGVVVAQYSTANRLSKLPPKMGPAPFTISQDRVTDENAEVSIEAPGDPLLHRPNVITPADFGGWVQERGLYFASQWDAAYHTVLSMHDAGEPPHTGGLLVARHGKGAYIYTGLAFFRQLPAGVPGAFRLFANLMAHGH